MPKGQITFTEVAEVLEQLPLTVRVIRQARGLSLREAAVETGVSFNAISRLERGGNTDVASAIALLRWANEATEQVSDVS